MVVMVACLRGWTLIAIVLVSHSVSAGTNPGVPPVAPPEKSPAVAAGLSVPPTVLGAGLVVAGLYVANMESICTDGRCSDHFDLGLGLTIAGGGLLAVGPSLGHGYAGQVWTTGLKLRLIGTGIAAAGIGVAVIAPSDCPGLSGVCEGQAIGLFAVLGGAITFTIGAGLDAVRASGAVGASDTQVSFAPLRTRSGTAPGIVLQTRF